MAPRDRDINEARPKTVGDSDEYPLDLAHLARQTLGDEALEREVLRLFAEQAEDLRARIATAGDEERRRLAHRLTGAARGIGAFRLAECAAQLEVDAAATATVDRLLLLIDDALAVVKERSEQRPS